MVVMGTIREAVEAAALVWQVDPTCIGSPNNDTKPGVSPIVVSCRRRTSSEKLVLNTESGALCRTPGVCLASKNNSDQSGTEIFETAETKNNGGIWKLKNNLLVNSFELCLSRDGEHYGSQLIQSKRCGLFKPCFASRLGRPVNGAQTVNFQCDIYENVFSFEEDTGKICRLPDVCLASKGNSNQDRKELIQTAVTTEKSGLWKINDGIFVNGFGLCLERDLDDSPSQFIQAKCNPASYWQKYL